MPEEEISQAAQTLVEKYDDGAIAYAKHEANAAFIQGHDDRHAGWLQILATIKKVLDERPPKPPPAPDVCADKPPKPKIRLRDAMAFYDALPAKTRGQFRDVAENDLLALHWGLGLFVRNWLIDKNDCEMLAADLCALRKAYEAGETKFTFNAIEQSAELAGDSFDLQYLHHNDHLSSELVRVLRLREHGKLVLSDTK
jgi:hypothetical protein